MKTEFRLSDPILELTVAASYMQVLVLLEVNRRYKVHIPVPIEGGAGLFCYKNSPTYFTRQQFFHTGCHQWRVPEVDQSEFSYHLLRMEKGLLFG